MVRRLFSLLLIFIFAFTDICYAAGDVYKGHAEFDAPSTELDKKLYTGKTETLGLPHAGT